MSFKQPAKGNGKHNRCPFAAHPSTVSILFSISNISRDQGTIYNNVIYGLRVEDHVYDFTANSDFHVIIHPGEHRRIRKSSCPKIVYTWHFGFSKPKMTCSHREFRLEGGHYYKLPMYFRYFVISD